MGYRGNAKWNDIYAISYFDKELVDAINKQLSMSFTVKQLKEFAKGIEPREYGYAGRFNKKTKLFSKNYLIEQLRKFKSDL